MPSPTHRQAVATLIVGALAAGCLVWCGLRNYVVFHLLAELFSIGVACGMFMVAWNTRRLAENHCFLFLGIAFLFIAILDLVHALSYPGMGVIPGATTNESIQLWIAARAVEAVALLVAPVFALRRVRVWPVLAAYGGMAALLLAAILVWRIFPECFVDDVGLTPFKKNVEYIICLLLMGAAAFMVRVRRRFHPPALRLLVVAILITVVSEFCFTLYRDPYETWNMVGHLLKILAFYLIYHAVIQETLVNPYAALFQGLNTARDELFTVFDNSPVAMVLLDENRQVRRANRQAENTRARAGGGVLGLPPGDVLACLHALKEPGGCGQTPHCPECVVRTTVNQAFAERRGQSRREGTMVVQAGGSPVVRNLLVSTVPLHVAGAPMVLVYVEDITELKKAEAEL